MSDEYFFDNYAKEQDEYIEYMRDISTLIVKILAGVLIVVLIILLS